MSDTQITLDKEFFFERSSLIRSFECGDNSKDTQIYFYHLEKTGGTSVLAFLQALAYATDREMGIPMRSRGRILEPPPASYLAPLPSIIGGHSTYGYHKFFYDNAALTVVLRHPVDRVLSDYFWKNSAKSVEILADKRKFIEFLDKQSRHNLITESLLATGEDPAKACDTVIERLSAFQYVSTTPGIGVLLEVIASVNGMPSLFLQRAKENPYKEIKAELQSNFASEIICRNENDAEVYAYAESRQQTLRAQHQQIAQNKQRDYGFAVGIIPMGEKPIAKGKTAWIYDGRDKGVYTKVNKVFRLSKPRLVARLPEQIDLNGIARQRQNVGA